MTGRIAVLGASRGLGAAVAGQIAERGLASELLISSRKAHLMENQRQAFSSKMPIEVFTADFSKKDDQDRLIERLLHWRPEAVIYCAGGGPHGGFFEKNWRDHLWGLEVSLLFPMSLLHALGRESFLRQAVFVGSAIAENQAHRLSSSYGAAKAGLKQWIAALQDEGRDIRLFSPGYMDTEMLPPNAVPRKTVNLLPPEEVAARLLAWLAQSVDRLPGGWHMTLNNP